MWEFMKTYSVAFVVFLVIDLLWLGLIAKNLYQKELGFIMAESPNWIAAGIFYLIFIVGLVFFVINPALAKDSWKYALLVGLFFGFITYSTYDLTNLATLKDWPLKVTLIDLVWGSSLGASVSTLTFFIVKMLG